MGFLTGIAAKLMLNRVPAKVWYGLGAVVLIGLAIFFAVQWHKGEKRAFKNAIVADTIQRRDAAWHKHLDEARRVALEEKRKGDLARAQLAAERRKQHEATVHIIHRTGDALRVSGVPEAAAAPHSGQGHDSGVTAAADRPEQWLRGGLPASAQLPFDGAVVSWNWLTEAGEQCDIARSEARTWRRWYEELSKTWPKP